MMKVLRVYSKITIARVIKAWNYTHLDFSDVDGEHNISVQAVCYCPFDPCIENEKTICAEQIKTEQFVEL